MNSLIKLTLVYMLFMIIPSFSIEVYPFRMELWSKANSEINQIINLKISESVTRTVIIFLNDWGVNENGDMMLTGYQGDWFVLGTSKVEIPPQSVTQVPFTVKVPNGDGERRVEVNFKAELNSNMSLTKTMPFYLMIEENSSAKLEIESAEFNLQTTKLEALINLHNLGNIHVRPGLKFILSRNKQKVREINILDDMPIYPNSTRKINMTKDLSEQNVDLGDYEAEFLVNYEFRGKTFTLSRKYEVSVNE